MTKKIATFVIIPLLFLMAFSQIAFMADEEATPTPIFDSGQTSELTPEKKGLDEIKTALGKTEIAGTDNVRDLVIKYVNFALPLLALAAFAGFVYAGFLYVTAYGEEEHIGKAKKVMTYAVIGLALVILSYSIVQLFTVSLVSNINQ